MQAGRAGAVRTPLPGLQRLMRDLKRLKNDPPQGVNGSPNSDDIMHWNAVIFGPEDTPWDSGEAAGAANGCGPHAAAADRVLHRRRGRHFPADHRILGGVPQQAARGEVQVHHVPSKQWVALSGPAGRGGLRGAHRAPCGAICAHCTRGHHPSASPCDPPPPPAPAVYADGGICLDILQNQWSPIYDVAAILTSIQSLLSDPNPNSPANSEAARLYSENRCARCPPGPHDWSV